MQQKFQIIYYAHSVLTYGTAEEQDAEQYLKDTFNCCLLCPNNSFSKSSTRDGYSKAVSRADVVIFSEYMDFLSCGVHSDVRTAINLDIPLYALRKDDNDEFRLYKLESIERLPQRTDYRYAKAIVQTAPVNICKPS